VCEGLVEGATKKRASGRRWCENADAPDHGIIKNVG